MNAEQNQTEQNFFNCISKETQKVSKRPNKKTLAKDYKSLMQSLNIDLL